MIPLATTTITVEAATELEPGEGRTTTIAAAGVRAVIGSPSGAELYAPGGGTSTITHTLNSDPCPELVDNTFVVVDDTTGQRFEVLWVQQRGGFGLEHTKAGLIEKRGRP